MCNIWRRADGVILPWEIYRDLIDGLGDMGCYYLSLSGGEPLLVRDIAERVRYAKKRIPYVHIVTNGYLLGKDLVEDLAKAGLEEISISIDGVGKDHDNLRGVEGAFEKAISAIANLKRYAPEVKVGVNTVVSPRGVAGLYDVVRLVERLGLYHKFQPINDHPLFEGLVTYSQRQGFTEEDITEVKRFIEFVKRKKNVLNSHYFLSRIPAYFLNEVDNGLFSDRCLLGYHHCEVKEDGTLYPCLTAMDWKGGFDISLGFRDVYSSEGYRAKLRELMDCRLCKRDMYICYLEPRVTFPIVNFFRYNLFPHA